MDKLVKVNVSISTNQRNDGKIDTTSIMTEGLADKLIEKLENGDPEQHFEIFRYLYNAGYLEARVRKMYECDIKGNYKEE